MASEFLFPFDELGEEVNVHLSSGRNFYGYVSNVTDDVVIVDSKESSRIQYEIYRGDIVAVGRQKKNSH